MDNKELSLIAKEKGYQKYKKTKAIDTSMSPYQVTVDDDTLIVVATTGDVEIILPQESSMVNGIYQLLDIISNPVNGEIIIKSYSGDSFRCGATQFIIPFNTPLIEIGLANHGHHLRKQITANLKIGIENWSASNWSTLTTVPFDDMILNNQEEFYTNNNGVITIMAKGNYDLSAMFSIDSTGGGTWNASFGVYINGVLGNYTELRTGNYGAEDQMATGINWGASLNSGDTVEVRALQSNLTGTLLFANFSMKIIVG